MLSSNTKHDRIHNRNQTHNMLHTLLYFLALFTLSTSSNWAKLNQMPVEVLGFYRLGIAALLVGIWVFLIKRMEFPKLDKKLLWVFLAGFFFFAHLWTFKYAAKHTTISNGMIIFSSNPVWASLGAVIFFKEKINFRQLASYLLALIGVYILVAHELKLIGQVNWGDISSFFSAIFFAIYMLSSKKARLYFPNNFFSFGQYLTCSVLFLFCILGTEASFTGYSNVSWIAVAGLILMPTFFGHLSMTYLVEHIDLSILTCGKLIEPIMASLIAAYLFNEKLSPNAPIAFSFTATSVLVLWGPKLVKYLKSKTAEGNKRWQ
jgi:drug/metabolite transporter (DMT)-like permease